MVAKRARYGSCAWFPPWHLKRGPRQPAIKALLKFAQGYVKALFRLLFCFYLKKGPRQPAIKARLKFA